MTKLESFLREVECFDAKWFRSIGGHSARRELQELHAAIARVREWAAAQKARCVEKRETLISTDELESWLKWRGSEHTVDVLLEFLAEVES